MRLLHTAIQNLIPPALLTYAGWAWRTCTFAVAYEHIYKYLNAPITATLYFVVTNTFIPSCVALFLRLYFLPASQSVPPQLPPKGILDLEGIFECEPPASAADGYVLVLRHSAMSVGMNGVNGADGNGTNGNDHSPAGPLLSHCNKGKCGGRWKPARARHCSLCGVCRASFDHHCAFLANCITAPYLPPFLAVLIFLPTTVFLLAFPFSPSLFTRAAAVWKLSYTAPRAVEWWNWRLSWLVPLGPVGRWIVGFGLAWNALDAQDGGGPNGIFRLANAVLATLGTLLSFITIALGWSTLRQIRGGLLTVDYERARAYAAARGEVAALTRANKPIPPSLSDRVERFAPTHWFFVPADSEAYAGVILPSLPSERPYDYGAAANLRYVITRGRGWRWILPWNAIQAGLGTEILNWPVASSVRARLVSVANGIVASNTPQSTPRRPGPDRLAYTRL